MQVTVFGESAGAISISLLMLNPKIDLFRGAIMQSGAQSTAPLGPTGDTWQKPYDDLVKLAGCAPVNTTVNGTSKVTVGNLTVRGGGKSTAVSSYSATEASFSCLKALPAGQLLNASITIKNMPQYLAPYVRRLAKAHNADSSSRPAWTGRLSPSRLLRCWRTAPFPVSPSSPATTRTSKPAR